MKIFVFHKRVTSAEEDLIIKSLPIQHFLSSALLSLSNGLMNILAMVSGMEVRHGSGTHKSTVSTAMNEGPACEK